MQFFVLRSSFDADGAGNSEVRISDFGCARRRSYLAQVKIVTTSYFEQEVIDYSTLKSREELPAFVRVEKKTSKHRGLKYFPRIVNMEGAEHRARRSGAE